ncbi:unnamed protein product [Xylocopa violacea]|uniref:Complex III subunit 9 n=1 Tax=Xylocopa violacea TaxID=135666 RepID=A0ABP1P074_XYLVO
MQVIKMQNFLYNYIFKRTSTFALTILLACFAFERTLDLATNEIFDRINKGKQWKDIKHKYETK